MSDLHQACARAIADELAGCKCIVPVRATSERAAAAAVGVCLAEAQRAIEAIGPITLPSVGSSARLIWYDEALAVLAALAEEQA